MQGAKTVWLPLSGVAERMGGLPQGLVSDFYDGRSRTPSSIDQVHFYVVPYPAASHEALALIEHMPKLEVVQALSGGVDQIRPYLPPGVTLCSGRGIHDASTAELAVTLLLSTLRGIPQFVQSQRTAQWRRGFFDALADKIVLIVGYGSIGAAVERRLAGFEVEIRRVARSQRHGVASTEELPQLLPNADAVILTVPLTEETQGMVNADFLSRMKDGATLVNVSRGPVVDTDALLSELLAERLSAACDVFDPEPLPGDHPLWRAPNMLISPHIGGSSTAFLPRAIRLLRDQLTRYAEGRTLLNVVIEPSRQGG